MAGEVDEGSDGYAAGAFGHPGFVFFEPCGSGDVEVNPGLVFDELLEEHGGGYGSAPAASGVLDVGDL